MLTYDMQTRGDASLYEHLYRCIRRDIECGTIAANEKLPSKREFAKHLGVSLITVEGAYMQLLAEGYIFSVPRKGYYACDVAFGMQSASSGGGLAVNELRENAEQMFHVKHSAHAAGCTAGVVTGHAMECTAERATEREAGIVAKRAAGVVTRRATECAAKRTAGLVPERVTDRVRSLGQAPFSPSSAPSASPAPPPMLADFTGATAPRGLFPYKAWARTVRETLSCESEETLLASSGAMGSRRLRQALADYLRGQRGMDVSADQIVVGAGSQTLYNLLVQLLGRDRTFAVEEPGYPRLTSIYRSNDVALAHVALDEAGVSVDALRESGADVLHCMPSHQLPTGLVTTIGRRRELLRWAAEGSNGGVGGEASAGGARPKRYIIEDDYDCEFRMAGRPIPSLQSIDEAETVIYTNTFTNSLGPSFRIGYMVLPPHLARQFRDQLGFYSCTVGAIDQVALARYIESGDCERHVNRLRTHYRRVQEALVDALQESEAASRLRFRNVGAGLHFVMEIDADASAEDIAARARELGVALAPLERYRLDRRARKGSMRTNGMESDSADEQDAHEHTACKGEDKRDGNEDGDRESKMGGDGMDAGTAKEPAAFVMNFASLREEVIPDVVFALNKCFT